LLRQPAPTPPLLALVAVAVEGTEALPDETALLAPALALPPLELALLLAAAAEEGTEAELPESMPLPAAAVMVTRPASSALLLLPPAASG
jgi:hypothetical protein